MGEREHHAKHDESKQFEMHPDRTKYSGPKSLRRRDSPKPIVPDGGGSFFFCIVLNQTKRNSFFCVSFFVTFFSSASPMSFHAERLHDSCLNKRGTTRYTNKARQNWGHVLPPVTNNIHTHKSCSKRIVLTLLFSHGNGDGADQVAIYRSIQEAVHRSHDLDHHRHSLVYRTVRSPVGLRGVVDTGANVLWRAGYTFGTSSRGQGRRRGRRGEALIQDRRLAELFQLPV